MAASRQEFNPLIGEELHTCMLSPEQVSEIYHNVEIRDRMIVGIQWSEESQVVRFLLGNFACVTVPCGKFEPKLDGTLPDFENPFIDDYGFDLYLGAYKIDVCQVLFE